MFKTGFKYPVFLFSLPILVDEFGRPKRSWSTRLDQKSIDQLVDFGRLDPQH